jgi:hypothetical protein
LVSGEYDASVFLGGLKPAAHLTYADPTGASLFKFDNAPLGQGLDWTWQLAPNGLTLMVVPEPGTLALLIAGALGALLPGTIRRRAPSAGWSGGGGCRRDPRRRFLGESRRVSGGSFQISCGYRWPGTCSPRPTSRTSGQATPGR